MVRLEMRIVNELGLHARAAAKFVEAASRFTCDIRLNKGKNHADGKSIMGILTLAAAKGEILVLELDGPDEEKALEILRDLVASGFGEKDRQPGVKG